MITSELCPTYANSSVGAAATAMNWSMNFVIGLVYPLIFQAIGGYSFCIFIGVGTVAFIFTYIMLPETKNRSIEHIFHNLRVKAKDKTAPTDTGDELPDPKQQPMSQQVDSA